MLKKSCENNLFPMSIEKLIQVSIQVITYKRGVDRDCKDCSAITYLPTCSVV